MVVCLTVALFGCPTRSVPCVPGISIACTCADGAAGAQRCDATGAFSACECTGRGPDGGLTLDAAACLPSAASEARCDRLDDDCDGIVDESLVCADSSLSNTEPYERGVWFFGTLGEGGCEGHALQQFSPTLPEGYLFGFDCYANWFHLADNGAVHYTTGLGGVLRDQPSTPDLPMPTPPCAMAFGHIGFDAENRFYYQCDGTLRREGQLLATDVVFLEAVLPSGRTVVSQGSGVVLLDVDGAILSRPDFGAWAGTVALVNASASVQGEAAWMLFRRAMPDGSRELVVMRVDGETARWSLVRRFYLMTESLNYLALPDGRVFSMRQSATAEDLIVEHPLDGSERIVYRETEHPVRVHGFYQLMTGPLL